MLSVIEDEATITTCQRTLKRAIAARATEKRTHDVGYPGGVMRDVTIYYIEPLDLWMAFEKASGRHFNPCGIGSPFEVGTPAPHLEINFPFSGINRRVAGIFLEDEDGVRYVGHSGKVGGGTKGVSLANFVAFYPGTTTVSSGGREMDVFVVGRLDDEDLGARLADFTRVSAEFRALVKAKIKGGTTRQPKPPRSPTFHPEFVGTKTYTTAERVEAEATHGRIVKELRDVLAASEVNAGNTQSRDLYVADRKGALLALFEVKTLANTTNVYGCLGQLLFHGGAGEAEHLVAVLPEEVSAPARARLEALGLHVVTFSYRPGRKPTFRGLDRVLGLIS